MFSMGRSIFASSTSSFFSVGPTRVGPRATGAPGLPATATTVGICITTGGHVGVGVALHAAYTEDAAALAAAAAVAAESFLARSSTSKYVGKTPSAMPTMTHCTAAVTAREVSEAMEWSIV